jgi:hypothetical protein
MALTSRALAFASKWFDATTVAAVFEPLVADWQREWQEASPAGRTRVSLRGLAAFLCAVIVSVPQIVGTTAPSSVTNHVATRIARFTFPAATLLIMPLVLNMEASWLSGIRILLIVPQALVLAFPFAMVGAVDAIRGHEALPPHVERAVVTKLAMIAVALMVVFHGWVSPAANQAWRTNLAPAGMTAPARGVRELTTMELINDPSRAYASETTNAWSRAAMIRRELNNRAHLALLPALLLWLRWGMLNRPRRRWYSPLPSWLLNPILIGAFLVLNMIGVNSGAAVGVWLPTLVFIAAGLISRWSMAPLVQTEAS